MPHDSGESPRRNRLWNRRDLLSATAAAGLSTAAVGTASAAGSDRPRTSSVSAYDVVDCGDWEYDGAGCIQSTGADTAADQDCWTEFNCNGGYQYTRDCCFDPHFFVTDEDSHTASGTAGIMMEGNLATTVSNLGSAVGGQWEETASGKWSTDFAIHTGYDMIDADDGDPVYVIESFETEVSVGTQNAYIHTYKNIHDPTDWVGATEDLDEYQDYDIADYVKPTAKFLASYYVEQLPYIGSQIGTAQDVAGYVNTMYNMLTYDPAPDQTINLEYDVDQAAGFSPWVRFRLDEMDPGQEVSIDVSEWTNHWDIQTNLSVSIQAPDEDPAQLARLSERELRRRNVERHRVGELRDQPEAFHPEMADEDVIHVKY